MIALCAHAGTVSAEGGSRPAAAGPLTVADVVITPPAGWLAEPSSGMRKGQFRLPGEKGSAEAAVFYFGKGQGGGTAANVERWLGQFQSEDGKPAASKTRKRKVGGSDVTIVEATGTYMSGMPGGPRTPRAGWALFGVIVASPQGPVFIKITGPAETLEEHAEGLEALVTKLELARV